MRIAAILVTLLALVEAPASAGDDPFGGGRVQVFRGKAGNELKLQEAAPAVRKAIDQTIAAESAIAAAALPYVRLTAHKPAVKDRGFLMFHAHENGTPVTVNTQADSYAPQADSYAAFGDLIDLAKPATGYMGISFKPASADKTYRVTCVVAKFGSGSPFQFKVTGPGGVQKITPENGKYLRFELDPSHTGWHAFYFSSKVGWIFRSCSVREQ